MAIRFGEYTLDAATRQLSKDGEELRVSPKAFQLLLLLIDRRPGAISKADLQKQLWPTTFVVEANLANLVGELRAVLADDSKSPRFIRTVYGFGYAFIGEATDDATSPPTVKSPTEHRSKNVYYAAVIAALCLSTKTAQVTATQSAVDRPIDSIAVTMFRVDRSVGARLTPRGEAPERTTSYISEGLTESLIDDLSTLHGVRVMSRNAVATLGARPIDARTVAQRLDVRAVVTGRVENVDDRIIVHTELIDGSDGSLLLARRYDAATSELPLLEAGIARDVMTRIQNSLPATRRGVLSRETADAEAYRLRLEGEFYSRRLDPESQRKAIDLYQQALARDPLYARAYSKMSRAYLMLGVFFDAPRSMLPRARALSLRALELDDTLSDAHVNLGVINMLYDWNRTEAERQLLTASGLRPEAIETFSCSSHLLESGGRGHDAEREIRQALAVDPLSSAVTAELGCNAYYQRRYDEAINQYQRALDLDPHNVLAYYGLGRAYGQIGRYDAAVASLKKVSVVNGFAPPIIVAELGYAYARAGQRQAAQSTLRELTSTSRRFFVDPFLFAVVYTGLGERDDAFRYLGEAFDVRSTFMPALAGDPKFDVLKSDTRFAPLVKRVGL